MMRLLLLFAAAAGLAAAAPVDAPVLEQLRAMDARLAGVVYRLATANAAFCRAQQPGTGLVLHAIDQYPAAADAAVRAVFGFPAPVAVEWVVPGSPGEVAGVRPNDGLTAIAGAALTPPTGKGDTSATRDAAEARLAAQPATAPFALRTTRGPVTIRPVAACRTNFEVLASPKLIARSDGRTIQISAPFFDRFTDEDIAVTAAHELAHTILEHRRRLEAAGASWGMARHFGRNARLFRTTEDEADLLGAFLLRNAGWDAQAAVRFWRGEGDKIDGGLFRSATHASAKDRAAAIAAGLAAMPHDAPVPWVPPALLASRDAALR